jgi:hypothetical protein
MNGAAAILANSKTRVKPTCEPTFGRSFLQNQPIATREAEAVSLAFVDDPNLSAAVEEGLRFDRLGRIAWRRVARRFDVRLGRFDHGDPM